MLIQSRWKSLTILIIVGMLLSIVLTRTQAQSPAIVNAPVVTIPTVESEHPYKNDENTFWVIPNNTGQNAARIHFTRIELETGVDKIEIRDTNETLIQEITSSAPTGMWSDVVSGASIKVVLKTDGSGRFWGFNIDQLEPMSYTTLAYSPHPYPKNSTATKLLVNNTPNPSGTRVHFDRIELEAGVDYLIIKDVNNVPYQWITGNYPSGFTSKAVPGSSINLQLLSDGSGQAWGYNVDAVQTAPAEAADAPPTHPVTLAESDHPYADNYTNVWIITNPNVNAMSSKIHFSRIDMACGDDVEALDANDTVVQTFGETSHLTDIWSDYVPGRIV